MVYEDCMSTIWGQKFVIAQNKYNDIIVIRLQKTHCSHSGHVFILWVLLSILLASQFTTVSLDTINDK